MRAASPQGSRLFPSYPRQRGPCLFPSYPGGAMEEPTELEGYEGKRTEPSAALRHPYPLGRHGAAARRGGCGAARTPSAVTEPRRGGADAAPPVPPSAVTERRRFRLGRGGRGTPLAARVFLTCFDETCPHIRKRGYTRFECNGGRGGLSRARRRHRNPVRASAPPPGARSRFPINTRLLSKNRAGPSVSGVGLEKVDRVQEKGGVGDGDEDRSLPGELAGEAARVSFLRTPGGAARIAFLRAPLLRLLPASGLRLVRRPAAIRKGERPAARGGHSWTSGDRVRACMGTGAKGKERAEPAAGSAGAAPPLDTRGARVSRPKYISAWLELDLRPQCSVCRSQRLHPPAYVPACLAASIVELAGGGDLDRAIDLNDERAGRLIGHHGLACLACVPKALRCADAAGDAEGEVECPMAQGACREPHPTLAALVPSSRVDGYLAYRAFVHEAERPESWAGAASVSQAAQHAVYLANRPSAARPSAPEARPALALCDGAGASSSSAPAPAEIPRAAPAPPEPTPAAAASAESDPEPPRRPPRRVAPARAASAAAEREQEDELEDGDASKGAAAAGPGPLAKRARRQPAERRPPWESEKLAKLLYQAYTCRLSEYDDDDDADAGSEEGAPGAQGEADPMETWEEERRAAFEGAMEELSSSSDSGSERGGGDEGPGRRVDAALVGIQLDADAGARRALYARAQHAGRERIRCLLLVSSGILGAFERFREANGRNPRSWGLFRKDSVEPKYSPILEACGLRLEDRAACAKVYADLCSCARVLQRLPGLARVVGDGVSPHDFIAYLPLLQRAPAEAVAALEQRLQERVASYKGENGAALVRMPAAVFRLKADGASSSSDGGGGGSTSAPNDHAEAA
eukprot:tig00000269_g23675.t1